MSFPKLVPKTEIQLQRAEEGHKSIWVYEDHDEVLRLIADAERGSRLVTFSRVQGIGNPGKSFSTRPLNIINVRELDR